MDLHQTQLHQTQLHRSPTFYRNALVVSFLVNLYPLPLNLLFAESPLTWNTGASLFLNGAALLFSLLGLVLRNSPRQKTWQKLVVVQASLSIFGFHLLYGHALGVQHLYFPILLILPLLFPPGAFLWISGGLLIFCYLVAELYLSWKPKLFRLELSSFYYFINIPSAMALMILILSLYLQEYKKYENLLREIIRKVFPQKIAELLEDGATIPIQTQPDITVVFCDLVGFTSWVKRTPPTEVISLLNLFFQNCDSILEKKQLTKLKTIGDAYMFAGGLFGDPKEDLFHCLEASWEIRDFVQNSSFPLRIRVGIHRGDVLSGILGTTRFAFDIWGETVNFASRIESMAGPGEILVSDTISKIPTENFVYRTKGIFPIKGLEQSELFLLHRNPGQ